MRMNNIAILNTMKEMENIKSEWNLLWENAANRTPYQSWEWNYNWIKGTAQEKYLYILIVRNQRNELVGIAPFRKKTVLGALKILNFIGQETSCYPDFIVQADDANNVLREIFTYLNDCSAIVGIDLKICEPSPSIRIYKEELENAKWYKIDATPYTTRLLVNYGDNYNRYLSGLSHDMRYAIKSSVKKLCQQYEVLFSPNVDSDVEFEQRLRELFNLKAMKWGGDPLKSHPGYREYYRSSRKIGRSKIFTLSCNGLTVGVVGASTMDNTIFAEITGFDFSVSKVDLGKVFYHYLFSWAIDNQFTKLDFITGVEPYKLRYNPDKYDKWLIIAFKNKYVWFYVRHFKYLSNQIISFKSRIVKSRLSQVLGLYSAYDKLKKMKYHL